jgi:short-subunit dehydrogenase
MKTVLLLGAYSDMGIALGKLYATHGYDIWLAGRSEEKLQDQQADLEVRYPSKASYYTFDATDYESHASFVEGLPGIPDVAICIFGLLGDQGKGQKDWDHAHQILSVNYIGAVSILNRLAEQFETRGSGLIIGISSVAGERGRQSNYLYGSAKGAFSLYLQGLRNRLAGKGVHVMTVKPGFVDTRMTEDLKLPKPITAQPDQVAKAIYRAGNKRKNVVYVLWMWRYIMLIIKMIPEPVFKKLKL